MPQENLNAHRTPGYEPTAAEWNTLCATVNRLTGIFGDGIFTGGFTASALKKAAAGRKLLKLTEDIEPEGDADTALAKLVYYDAEASSNPWKATDEKPYTVQRGPWNRMFFLENDKLWCTYHPQSGFWIPDPIIYRHGVTQDDLESDGTCAVNVSGLAIQEVGVQLLASGSEIGSGTPVDLHYDFSEEDWFIHGSRC